MDIPTLADNWRKEDACQYIWEIDGADAVVREYSGDFQSNSDEEPYASGWTYQTRLEELVKKGLDARIALIQGYRTEGIEAVVGTKLLPYEGVSLPDASKKTIKERVNFLYETFSEQIREEGQKVVGFVIDNPYEKETSFKIHGAFEENYLHKGPFHALEEHEFGKSVVGWMKSRFEHYKNIFGWN